MSTRHVWSSRIRHGVRIPMRDGAHLSADLYLPDGDGDGGPWPVVIEYQPYRKDEVDSEKRFYTGLPQHGYVVARLDVRGTGASAGTVTEPRSPVRVTTGPCASYVAGSLSSGMSRVSTNARMRLSRPAAVFSAWSRNASENWF